MKTTERHQQGRAGDFIVKLKKSTFFTILLLNKKTQHGKLLFKIFFLNR